MRTFFCAWMAAVCLVAFPQALQAHHTSGHGSGGSLQSSLNPLTASSRPPSKAIDAGFVVDRLDGGLGYVLRYDIGFEYAVTKRFSLGAQLPFLSVREILLPATDRLGDIELHAKTLIYQSSRFLFTAGTGLSLPTGSEEKGTGAGTTLASPFVTLSKGHGKILGFMTLGSTLSLGRSPDPSFDYAVGVLYPLSRSSFPVDASLTFQGSTGFSDDVFESGSTKAYLQPAVILHWSPRLSTLLGAKVAVVDTLSVKSGVTLSQQSTVPLSDILAGFVFHMNYAF